MLKQKKKKKKKYVTVTVSYVKQNPKKKLYIPLTLQAHGNRKKLIIFLNRVESF